MKDYLVRIIAGAGSVRALACVTTELVNEACHRHGTYPTASAALGRALTGGALLGAMLKTRQRVALKFEGNGPLKKIIVEAESNGAVRGYVAVPTVHLPEKNGKLDVGSALGHAGFLTVTKDLGLKEPYKGMVQLYTSEIAEDLAYYLTTSEQVPSAVGLGVYVEPDGDVVAAGGFLIQALPSQDLVQDHELVDSLMAHIESMPPITELLRQGKTPEHLLELLFAGVSYEILEKRALAYQCSCSKEKVEKVLISFGKEELTNMVEEQGNVEVTCEFCRAKYIFNREEVDRLRDEISGETIH